MRNVQKFGVCVDSLHVGDQVYYGDRQMNVMAVNRDGRRVLISGRKFRTGLFDCFWAGEKKLRTRPRKFSHRKFRNVKALVDETGDGVVDWFPTKACEPTGFPPGSAGKIEVLRRRVALGQVLWSDDDADYSGAIRAIVGDEAYERM